MFIKKQNQDFPGRPMWMPLSANAGNTSSIPGLGRFHRSQVRWADVPELRKRLHSRAHALQQEQPTQPEACALQLVRSPANHSYREPEHSNKDSAAKK